MTSSIRSIILTSALLLGLSACATPEKPVEPAEIPEQPALETTSKKAQEQANLPRVAMLPPERALRDGLQGPDAPEPKRLVGLRASEIQKMLGNPEFKRRDHPAEIWQYRRDTCMLDIFLYQEKDSANGFKVNHVEARGKSIAEVSGTECLLEALAK